MQEIRPFVAILSAAAALTVACTHGDTVTLPFERRHAAVSSSAPAPEIVEDGTVLRWFDADGHMLRSGRALLDALERAEEHGLPTDEHALSRIRRLASSIADDPTAAASDLAELDEFLTTAFLDYASRVSTGRIHPQDIDGAWHAEPPDLDLERQLDDALSRDALPELLASLPPPHAPYARLRRALAELRAVADAGGWPVVAEGPTLERGSVGPRVVALRERFGVGRGVADERFDQALAEAVVRFQQRHGLEPDGKVGVRTLAALNEPVEERIRQIELNLERWRWVPRELGDPHVLVNVPAFDLRLVRDGAVEWRTRIVVGSSYKPTPVFSDRIVGLLVNPPWNVPQSIVVEEYLDEIRDDASELERRGFRLIEGEGERARVVGWEAVDRAALDAKAFPYRLRQDPGPANALGRLKFELTNDFRIYLHDTPARALFERTARASSHGCIRVERPVDLAEALLDPAGRDLLDEALAQPESRRLRLDPPVSVHILYITAWVEEDGVLHFAPDVYELDSVHLAALERVEGMGERADSRAPEPGHEGREGGKKS